MKLKTYKSGSLLRHSKPSIMKDNKNTFSIKINCICLKLLVYSNWFSLFFMIIKQSLNVTITLWKHTASSCSNRYEQNKVPEKENVHKVAWSLQQQTEKNGPTIEKTQRPPCKLFNQYSICFVKKDIFCLSKVEIA